MWTIYQTVFTCFEKVTIHKFVKAKSLCSISCSQKNCLGGRESEVLGVWFCISSSNCGLGEPSGNSREPLPRQAASARSSAPSVCSAASLRAREGGEQTPRPPAPGTRRRSALACSAGTSLPVSATTAEGKKNKLTKMERGFAFLELSHKRHYSKHARCCH